MLLKSLLADWSYLAVTLPGREANPRPASRPWVTQESKSIYSKQVRAERRGSRAVAGRPAAFVSQAANGGEWRSRKSRRWLIHGLARRLCVDSHTCVCVCVCVYVCAWCVSRAHSRWQIGKATDGPGSISTAGCCDVSILPSLTTQPGRTRACPCDCLCVPVCFCCLLPSHGVCVCVCVCVCCFKIRGAITLFAKYNKGKSLSWRCRCRTASTANVVDESTGTRQLAARVCLTVFSCVCVGIRSRAFVHDCARLRTLFLFTNACTLAVSRRDEIIEKPHN